VGIVCRDGAAVAVGGNAPAPGVVGTAMDTQGFIPRYVMAFAVMVVLLVLPGLVAQL
jgi:hypothetical protein